MLDLSDKRWADFQANYTNGITVAALLERAYSGELLDRWYDDLFQEICHQYTVSPAAYPAAPHLVLLAGENELIRKHLLVLLGACHAFADETTSQTIPSEVREAWDRSAKEAIPLSLQLLAEPQPSSSDLLYLLSSLAAFHGHPSLARAMEEVDYEIE